jgi:hypothetical protein
MINEIYNALFDRVDDQLTQDVFDHVPENYNTFPYIKIDPPQIDDNDTDDKAGFTGTIQITAFSRYKGSKEAADIALNIYNALNRYDMPDTSNYGFSTINQEFSNIITADDGLTRHSVQRFRIIFELLL